MTEKVRPRLDGFVRELAMFSLTIAHIGERGYLELLEVRRAQNRFELMQNAGCGSFRMHLLNLVLDQSLLGMLQVTTQIAGGAMIPRHKLQTATLQKNIILLEDVLVRRISRSTRRSPSPKETKKTFISLASGECL